MAEFRFFCTLLALEGSGTNVHYVPVE